MSDEVTDLNAYRRGADRVRDALAEALGRPLDAKALRTLAAERRYGPYEPGGRAWEARKARHGGEEFQGGPACWPPDICAGTCSACPKGDQP